MEDGARERPLRTAIADLDGWIKLAGAHGEPGMSKAASIARITAATVSAFYMLVLLPHFGAIEAAHFKSGWFLSALAVSLVWIPLLLFRRYLAIGGMRRMTFSVAPLVLMVAYFGALLSLAG
ncbi:hypothetical protein DAH66_09975 [Sphingomonas koreensis]|uniref:Uncharacterized protein n=1 Tax=Sphingomonas koreensis TaxID=93064 RepID=A0A430C1J9_9SPHN|nr:hypothetical protein DAH56_14415 [Sphingomonas koreensis]RSY86006.1 hypothetical protein DAH66_09975 [Sphingomonas koreensis]